MNRKSANRKIKGIIRYYITGFITGIAWAVAGFIILKLPLLFIVGNVVLWLIIFPSELKKYGYRYTDIVTSIIGIATSELIIYLLLPTKFQDNTTIALLLTLVMSMLITILVNDLS